MKGILFNHKYHMWQSTLSGIKTQTRRTSEILALINQKPTEWVLAGIYKNPISQNIYFEFMDKETGKIFHDVKPRHQPGDIVYLQEPTINLKDYVTKTDDVVYLYPDHKGHSDTETYKLLVDTALKNGAKWGNKLHMPAKHARYFAKITKVKIEPLFDISYLDCEQEGIMFCPSKKKSYYVKDNVKMFFSSPRTAYLDLLKKVGKEPMAPNPWLFVYDFEILHASHLDLQNIDLKNTAKTV